ncbi:MAG TPA: SAM-dependent chlorinase/fluorinase [Terriglobales bacterium]|nr:SAM-dependent chlorinase/fluorinase [Terriglobales bacterium]
MPTTAITLLTDYGEASAYVAMLKGALLGHCPEARLVDLSHALAGDDPFPAAFLLLRVYPYYPAGTVHLVGVDRGQGRSRALVASAAGQHFLALDQGALGLVLEREAAAAVWAVELAPRTPFVARDVLAPLAARLAQGSAGAQLGARVEDWQRLALPQPRRGSGGVEGQVLEVDRFGNLITNFTRAQGAQAAALRLNGVEIARWCHNYADAPAGELCLMWGAEGWLEVVEARASAAARLGAGAGTPAVLR